jgi:hypothetical protein
MGKTKEKTKIKKEKNPRRIYNLLLRTKTKYRKH